MSERWHMNRMGFVNFWLYDDEVFSFADGKLLLRGQNGSGKSITTQSFIPFILDGDRTPSRLDPFGSSDRRMEYYFLGDGEKEEATGYLYLEFQKGNRYRTIGIGQQAQKGKSMGFWGFVLLDGRRIGYDFSLYREAGNTKIACTKQEIKKKLGEENPFTEAQKDYMGLVNKYIFGFPRQEQYEQFIRLLIKVRAPKLSKEFKPTKVYEILNDSLQALSDEDLRAMVDAMEKMDDIQDKLEGLKRAYKDLQIIRKEYTKYNQYMLAQKAAAYLEEKAKADEGKESLEAKIKECKEKKEQLEKARRRSLELAAQRKLLEKEKEAIGTTDLEEAAQKLRQCQKRREEAEREAKIYAQSIELRREEMRECDAAIREIRKKASEYRFEIEQLLGEMDSLQEVLSFSKHAQVKKLWEQERGPEEIRKIKRELEELYRKIQAALAELKVQKEVQAQWDRLSEEYAELEREQAQAQQQAQEAETMEYAERDRLLEAYYELEEQGREFSLTKRELEQMTGYVQQYQSAADYGCVHRLLSGLWESKRGNLLQETAELRAQKEEKKEAAQSCQRELEELEKNLEMAPVRKDSVDRTREKLAEGNISFLPFYEGVDFAENLSEEERSLLECQLEDAGLLDALIVAPKEYEKAIRIVGEGADKLLYFGEPSKEVYEKLTAAAAVPELREAVEGILRNIGTDKDARIVLRPDGYFRHGALEGYSKPEREACYIGEAVRREKKREQIQKKQEELQLLWREIEALEAEIDRCNQRQKVLDEEYRALPTFTDLDQAIEIRKNADWTYKNCRQACEKKQREKEACEEKKKQVWQRVIACCREMPYERSVEGYEEVAEALQEYQRCLDEMLTVVLYLSAENNKEITQNQRREQAEAALDVDDQHQRKARREEQEQQIQIERLQEFLNAPENREKAARLQAINQELEEKNEAERQTEIEKAVCTADLQRLEPDIENQKADVWKKSEKEGQLRRYFEEELSLALVFAREKETIPGAAAQARTVLSENDRNKSVAEMVSNLDRIFHGHMGSLAAYGVFMEECFGEATGDASILRKRHRIVAYMQGRKLYFEDFYKIVKEKIDETEVLIRQKDRELFENILSDTLSRKLNLRIAESRRWIQDMSSLMRKMDTSMSLTFSLDWRAKTAEGEEELDTAELEKLLNRDRELMTAEDIAKISVHFRNKIYMVKQAAEENGEVPSYFDVVREALDYRKWFEFKMYYYRSGENRKELTNGAFNRFSGGEKAMAMYVPLFAAVNAQYKKAEHKDLPRIIALDEAFAGVDDKNISSMFALVKKFDFDYIMNSQVLWGCYADVPSLRIAELLRPANSQVVTVIYYLWNGKQKMIEEQ